MAKFLSTLPARGATRFDLPDLKNAIISIHAPREGSDTPVAPGKPVEIDFYPRSPRGERL